MQPTSIQIQLNDEDKIVAANTTVAMLLAELKPATPYFAVAINNRIIARAEHERYCLQDADRVIVVQAVGGG